jgi:hypothetical protein
MNTNRAIKTTTALNNALTAAGLDADDRRRVISALRTAAREGKATSGATVRYYPNGWVPNGYRYPAVGREVTVTVSPFGVQLTERKIDRKRPWGNGPRISVRALRPGMVDGTLVASL